MGCGGGQADGERKRVSQAKKDGLRQAGSEDAVKRHSARYGDPGGSAEWAGENKPVWGIS
jgi:hypothetical protein